MPTIPPSPPEYTPGGYWYRPPFTPRFSIPQTFGEALSYEAQIHWLASLCSDADDMLRTLSAMHYYYGPTSVDTSAFEPYHPFTYTTAEVAEGDYPKPGDFVGLVIPDADPSYKTDCLVIARVLDYGQPCNKLELAWYYTIHDPTAWLESLDADLGALANRVTSLETRVKTLEDTAGEQGDAITNIRNQITQMGHTITNLGDTVSQHTTKLTKVEADLTELQQQVDDNTQDISAHSLAIGQNAKSIGDLMKVQRLHDKTFADILSKVFGGGTVDPATGAVTWGQSGKIAVGNINIFSADATPTNSSDAIRTHAGTQASDLWQK